MTTFEDIVREHGPMIRRIASTYERGPDIAEELVQEIYLAIWRALPSFRGDALVRTFVARIATNRAVTHVARTMKLPRSAELDERMRWPGDNPERVMIGQDRRAALAAAVRRLPLVYRQPVALVLEGLTLEEIGHVLGITVNAVAIRMSRGRELLRQLMGGARL